MTIGYILITTKPHAEREVYSLLNKMPKVVEVHPLFGEYDIIAKVEVKNFKELGAIVSDSIRSIKGVADTKTLMGTRF